MTQPEKQLSAMLHEKLMPPEHLGHCVYAELEHRMVKLTTNNGCSEDQRNVIYLAPSTLRALESWLERVGWRADSGGDK